MNSLWLSQWCKSCLFLSFIFPTFFLSSCGNFSSISGKWEDKDRVLVFDDYENFSLEFKNTSLVKGFCGKYLRNKNVVILFFEEFENFAGEWFFTDGTDFENYKEVLFISFENENLVTEIKATGKRIVYSKVSLDK